MRFRIAAFNFLNHGQNSFGTGYAQQTNLSLNSTSSDNAPYSPSSGFALRSLQTRAPNRLKCQHNLPSDSSIRPRLCRKAFAGCTFKDSTGHSVSLVREGTILPIAPLVQSTNEKPQVPLTLRIYAGNDCVGHIYVDDGTTCA
jgi:hypothetical protein